ncbi:MAG: DUF2336 domain-containing protein [Rhizobiales bacterium]|nr:DUF2336 domain-containing protein [Hyphomicrobiales bacterium]
MKNRTAPRTIADDADYLAAVEALSAGDTTAMEQLASDWRSAPEVLFYLSQSPHAGTRVEIAGNPSTPDLVDELLLGDDVCEVRAALGRKIAAKLPELSGPEAASLRDAATAKLLVLAREAEVEVRRALSSAVAELDCVPKKVVDTLARDVDALVSVPIIEFSPLLDDDDLIALIAEPPNALALGAMARRAALAPDIVDSLIDTKDNSVMLSLLRNTTTQIRESALDRIVDHAREVEELHAPLVSRSELTDRLVCKLSKFVSSALIFDLSVRSGLSDEMREILEDRLAHSGDDRQSAETPSEADIVSAARRHAHREVIAGLAMRADLTEEEVERVFAMGLPKAIVALAWKSDLSMAAAGALQAFPGRILLARRVGEPKDGSYPIPADELEWHLSTLGIGGPASEGAPPERAAPGAFG